MTYRGMNEPWTTRHLAHSLSYVSVNVQYKFAQLQFAFLSNYARALLNAMECWVAVCRGREASDRLSDVYCAVVGSHPRKHQKYIPEDTTLKDHFFFLFEVCCHSTITLNFRCD